MTRSLLARLAAVAALVASSAPAGARADDLSAESVLGPRRDYFSLASVSSRITAIDQQGRGYQSRSGPVLGPGDERLTVFQPILDVVVRQGRHVTHDVQIPVDIVTAASPDAIDVVSTASRRNEAGEVDWTATYAGGSTSMSLLNGFHNEENWRSWNTGAAATRAFAEDNTVVATSFHAVFDWFDKYTFVGKHQGHTSRSTLNGNLGVTQILSPSTIAVANYGLSVQRGQLSNGWNTVARATNDRVLEVLPDERARHALVGHVAQWLPWNGALKVGYRFYGDDWGITAHTADVELDQRVSRSAFVGATYRLHRQTAPDFFTTRLADPTAAFFTADSDLAAFVAQTVGVKASVEIARPTGAIDKVVLDLAVERYWRQNDLRVVMLSWGLGVYLP